MCGCVFSVLLGGHPGAELLGHMGILCLTCRDLQTVSPTDCPIFSILQANATGLELVHVLTTTHHDLSFGHGYSAGLKGFSAPFSAFL